MDFESLLRDKDCSCGKRHSCAIKHVIIEAGAVFKISGLINAYRHILVVADKNTYATCGKAVCDQLGNRMEDLLVFMNDGLLVPDEAAMASVQEKMTAQTDLILGIGSGVIQDLCKYVSFLAHLPYYIVATAPSMDGYASSSAAMIANQMKITYPAHVPEVIIGDVDVLKNAPMDMIQSGYGDILGKYSCLNDWKLGRVVNDEYFCQYVYDLTFDMLMQVKDLPEKLLAREPEAIKTLMEALVGIGVAMAYVGNSRPGSGSEHHLSHFFEIVGLLEHKDYFLHGIDVVFSTVRTQQLREELLKLETPPSCLPISKQEYEERIHTLYHDIADGIIALQEKMGWYHQDKTACYTSKWSQIKEVLSEVPSSDDLRDYIRRIGLRIEDFTAMYGEEKIQNAIWFAKDLKDRYSVLWMYFELMYERKKVQ